MAGLQVFLEYRAGEKVPEQAGERKTDQQQIGDADRERQHSEQR